MTSSVYIAKNVYGGDGLGRLGDGRVVFVPGAWAGESVKAEIFEEKRKFVKARLVEIEDASPERIGVGEPTIPGMVYANLSFAGENAVKDGQLRDFFDRARLEVSEFISAPPCAERNYRNKVVYHFARQGGKWVIGYRREPGHEIVEIADDPLARPEINAALPEIRKGVLTLLTQGVEAVKRSIAQKGNVTIRWSARSGVRWWIGEPPADSVIREVVAGKVFEVPGDGFFQVNPEVGGQLVKAVVEEYVRGAAIAPEVLDLYCGVGVFGLVSGAERIVGVESGRQAIDFARRNAAMQGVAAKFFAEQVGRSTRRIRVGSRTTVIVDPPRGGMEPRVPEWLAASGAPRVLYVSCDPATLIRDLRPLSSAYAIERVRWFNMFPRTARFETLVTLRRR